MIENKSVGSRIRVITIYIIVIALGLSCIIPLWHVVCLSFSGSMAINGNRVGLVPVDFTLQAYQVIINDSIFGRSFLNSVIRVIITLCINMVMIVLMAYPLTKNREEFGARNIYMTLIIISMLFSGGLIPAYMLMVKLKLINTIWALILPAAVPIGNVILVKNFFLTIPKSLEEAAILDGANPLDILRYVFLPCSKPVLATVALFSIVGSWNDFFSGLVYITQVKKYPLMTYIQSIDINLKQLVESGIDPLLLQKLMKVSSNNLNSAKIIVALVPLLLIYPLLQKYLITGIVMGAVKE